MKVALLPLSKPEKNDLSLSLLKCLDKGLDTFGESTKRVVYWNFERSTHLKQSEIPEHLEEFSKSLDMMFGMGSATVKRKIAVEVSNLLHVRLSDKDDFLAFMNRVGESSLTVRDGGPPK